MTDSRLRIAVVCGGGNAEREVSLASGRAMANALSGIEGRYRVDLVDLADMEAPLPREMREADVALLALHGGAGEDGTIQMRLDEAGIPYQGCGAPASALAMDKHASKIALRAAGLPTPDSILVARPRDLQIDKLIDELGLPMFVKPIAEGSSVGVTRAHDQDALMRAILGLHARGIAALVEQDVRGKELTVTVLDGRALPIVEIVPAREFYDYEAKYKDPGTRYFLDHGLVASAVKEIERVAIESCIVHDVQHIARVDIIHDGVTPWVLELNTLPGMTERSLAPKAAAAAGIPFAKLCERLVELALRDRGAKRRLGEQGVA